MKELRLLDLASPIELTGIVDKPEKREEAFKRNSLNFYHQDADIELSKEKRDFLRLLFLALYTC